ncbi:MAG: hypothetical protein NTX97_13045 [Bacteroidetes bacterium]|nr:hypothetical protein [Bacteroidota bacterium]
MKNIFRVLFLVLVYNTAGYSQCNGFAKKSITKLKPYLNTQQVFSTVLLNGDKTQLSSTFYYGDEYRLLISAQDQLGKIQLNVKDAQGNVVYTTKAYGTIMWDFNVESTQDLTLELITPPAPEKETVDKSGCVSIVIGFK